MDKVFCDCINEACKADHVCCCCGISESAVGHDFPVAPDPFSSDIFDDDTDVRQCDSCNWSRFMAARSP
jgi:hypothetical protein